MSSSTLPKAEKEEMEKAKERELASTAAKWDIAKQTAPIRHQKEKERGKEGKAKEKAAANVGRVASLATDSSNAQRKEREKGKRKEAGQEDGVE